MLYYIFTIEVGLIFNIYSYPICWYSQLMLRMSWAVTISYLCLNELKQRCEDYQDISRVKIIINSFTDHSGYGQVIYLHYLAGDEQGEEKPYILQ